jgi:N-acylneuraminate cytidylyltransferase/CMP-N,N'-diacetyllegionaminic acid synthase
VICSICARGGSKGVRSKNTRVIAASHCSSIAWSRREPAACSTCRGQQRRRQSPELAREHGADVLVERPAELATDTAGKLPAIQHCSLRGGASAGQDVRRYGGRRRDSPLREPNDIVAAVETVAVHRGVAT